MCEYDILVCVKFLSHEKGGRQYLPPIKNSEYTYRPIFKLEKKVGYYILFTLSPWRGDAYPREEARTIGVGEYKNDPITENALRRQLKYAERLQH